MDISFGSTTDEPRCTLLGIKYFERERRVDSNKRESLIHYIAVNPGSSQKGKESALKKRKLKPSRTVGLNKMLEGL